MWADELKLAEWAARIAGKYLLEIWDEASTILASKGKDIKLKGDLESEKRIINYLEQNSPYPILSEERGKNVEFLIREDTIYWILDPLDGSLNYSRSTPLACVSLALWKGQKPILGVVYDFNRDELFSRIVGSDLTVNSKNVKSVFKPKAKKDSVIATGFPSGRSYDEDSLLPFLIMVQKYKKVRLLGSAALSLAWVAIGRFDVYSEEGIYLWDIAAGLALVEVDQIYIEKISRAKYKYYVLAGRTL